MNVQGGKHRTKPGLERDRSFIDDAALKLGLFRHEVAGAGKSVLDVFAALGRHERAEPIAGDPTCLLHGTRLVLDRTQGHGAWEFYLLDRDVFLVTNELVFDTQRVETVPGEGLVAFHLRLAGRLDLEIPGRSRELSVQGPRVLVWYQSPGCSVKQQVGRGIRESTITLYCRTPYLRSLMERNGIGSWPLLEEIERRAEDGVWYREMDMTAGLMQVGNRLLQNSYRGGVRLLHAEAMALDLLCAILDLSTSAKRETFAMHDDAASPRLEKGRQLLQDQLNRSVHLSEVARAIGMSESVLKRAFKERYGTSVFEFRLACRMRHALELLRFKNMAVGQVAYAVGYQHHSSFSAAFTAFYGYHPNLARKESRGLAPPC